jgi:hypothetical protein
VLARFTPGGYAEQSRTKVINAEVWSHPGFAGDRVFIRGDGAEAWQGGGPYEIVCVSLTEAAE